MTTLRRGSPAGSGRRPSSLGTGDRPPGTPLSNVTRHIAKPRNDAIELPREGNWDRMSVYKMAVRRVFWARDRGAREASMVRTRLGGVALFAATLVAMAGLVQAAPCGNTSAGFERWKRAFAV